MDIGRYITSDELIYIAIIAFFVTWFIHTLIRLKKIMTAEPGDKTENAKDIRAVMERCYALFPLEKFSFKGQEFSRGMKVKITTFQDRVFEGELIGTNSRNLICIMTSRNVVAHEISNIRDITLLES